MSTVVLGHIQAGVGENDQIKMDDEVLATKIVCTESILSPGCMTQYKYVRSDLKTTYSAPTGNVDTLITPMGITITPRSINSILHCQWQIMGEVGTNAGFRVALNGVVPTDGYNTEAGNVQWSVISPAYYDADTATTPTMYNLLYIFVAGSLSPITITPTIRATGAGVLTFYLNRAAGGTGANDSENGVSFGYVMEIAQ